MLTAKMTADGPAICSPAHHAAFESEARSLGFDPSERWVGGYVAYEWEHLRHLIEALPIAIAGLKVLEVGCNFGASSVVFSKMRARVTAFDTSSDFVHLARLNSLQYGRDDIIFDYVADSSQLPYEDGQFDLISCNSVMEYVSPENQRALISEVCRVVAPRGLVLLTGTSNRLWPREAHSGRWFTNYLPRAFDALMGSYPQRGLFPWRIRREFGKAFTNLDTPSYDGFFAHSRSAMGMSAFKLRSILIAAKLLRTGPGFLTPTLSCILQKK